MNASALDPLMLALGVLVSATALDWHPDMAHLAARTHGGKVYRVEFEQLDELVERGWITLEDERCDVTGRGYYEFQKWSKKYKVRLAT